MTDGVFGAVDLREEGVEGYGKKPKTQVIKCLLLKFNK